MSIVCVQGNRWAIMHTLVPWRGFKFYANCVHSWANQLKPQSKQRYYLERYSHPSSEWQTKIFRTFAFNLVNDMLNRYGHDIDFGKQENTKAASCRGQLIF